MSGRGGGGGGGRGGGGSWGGRGQLSQSKEFLKRSAQEAGLDDRHMKLLSDITRPAFYPDVLWRASGDGYWNENDETDKTNELIILKRLPTVINTMNKQRELMNRFQKSSHYVRPDVTVDIERYSTLNDVTSTLAPSADVAVLQSLGRNGKLANDDRYFPTELIFPNINSNKKKKNLLDKANRMKKINLDDDELVTGDGGDGGDDNADNKIGGDDSDDDDDELEEFEQMEDEEEEDGEDYITNHYDSDNDSGGGGGGGGDDDNEPTFD